ncbi:cytochrome P450 [Serendipita vermifera]|nr:cytochrome P450 [Serendipita vermifera]
MEILKTQLGERSYVEIAGIGLVAVSVLYACNRVLSRPKHRVVYPPGPPKDPFIGNLRQFPKDNWWSVFNQWQKEYGDIVFLDVPTLPFVIINSLDTVQELLSKRANNISGRKVGYMCQNLMGWEWNFGLRQADATHLTMRKMFRHGIGPQRVASHDHLTTQSSNQWLLTARSLEGDVVHPLSLSIGEIIITMAYGRQIWNAYGPELVKINNEAMDLISKSFTQFWLVDIFTWMRFIPSWMPGAGFRRIGIHSTKLTTRIRSWPYAEAVKLFNSGKLDHSLASDLLEANGPSEYVQDCLAVLYFNGVDTTASALSLFFLAMFMFPDIAQKVQDEITSVVGSERLPDVSDWANLPYTEAVWKESLRWNPSVPFGIPHVNINDESIDGYFIPKGSIINPNIGFMLNDPRIWGDPEVFRPERHLGPEAAQLPNPLTLVFGFGMRICPGMHLADRVGFHFVAKTLSVYNIVPLEGAERLQPSSMKCSISAIRVPENLECRFVPRNEKARELLSSLSMAMN